MEDEVVEGCVVVVEGGGVGEYLGVVVGCDCWVGFCGEVGGVVLGCEVG